MDPSCGLGENIGFIGSAADKGGVMTFQKVHLSMAGRDEISIAPLLGGTEIRWLGCPVLDSAIQKWRSSCEGEDPMQWPLPQDFDHGSLLLREALLRYRGQWSPPYTDEDICHCRRVSTRRVQDAILNGSHTLESLRRDTSAGSSCGSCRGDLSELLDYCLSGNEVGASDA